MRRFSKADIARMQAGKLPEPSEDDTQKVIVDGLKAYGYTVLVTTRRKLRCYHCGKVSNCGDRADKGIPDLLVWCAEFLPGHMIGLEVKRPGAVRFSSPEQKALEDAAAIIVVQSLEEALVAVGFKS